MKTPATAAPAEVGIPTPGERCYAAQLADLRDRLVDGCVPVASSLYDFAMDLAKKLDDAALSETKGPCPRCGDAAKCSSPGCPLSAIAASAKGDPINRMEIDVEATKEYARSKRSPDKRSLDAMVDAALSFEKKLTYLTHPKVRDYLGTDNGDSPEAWTRDYITELLRTALAAAPLSAIGARVDFIYLLNAFEAAAHDDAPADVGYAAKRQAVLDYVAKLEAGGPTKDAVDAAERYLDAGFLGYDKSELLCNEIVRLAKLARSDGGAA